MPLTSSTLISTNRIISVDYEKRDPLEGLLIPRKVTEVVPAHCIDVGLSDFFPQRRVVFGKKTVHLLVPNKGLLLDDLSVDVGRS